MVKFAAAGYVCVDYYPDFNNRYYITGNGVDVLFNLLDIKKGKDMEASIISAVSDDEYGKEAVKMFRERNIDCSHLEVIPEGMTPRVPLHLVDNDRVHGTPVRGIMKDYEFSKETLEYICRHDMMHSDFTGRLNHRLGDIRKSGTKVFFDLGNNLKHPDLEEVIQNIDCGLVSFGNDFEEGANDDLVVVDKLTWEPTDEFDKGCGLCMAYGNEDFANWCNGFFSDIKAEGLWDQMQSDAAAELDAKALEDFIAQ